MTGRDRGGGGMRKLSVPRAVFTSLGSIIMLVHAASWVKVAQKHPGRRKNFLVGPSKIVLPLYRVSARSLEVYRHKGKGPAMWLLQRGGCLMPRGGLRAPPDSRFRASLPLPFLVFILFPSFILLTFSPARVPASL